jgi:signal transduction histidine kinase/PAS domain-containing protein
VLADAALLWQTLPSACLVIDSEGYISGVNGFAERCLGIAAESWHGALVQKLVEPVDQGAFLQGLSRARRDGYAEWQSRLCYATSPTTTTLRAVTVRAQRLAEAKAAGYLLVVEPLTQPMEVMLPDFSLEQSKGDRPYPPPSPPGHSEPLRQPSSAHIDFNEILDGLLAAITCYCCHPDGSWEYVYHSLGVEQLFGFSVAEFEANKYLWLSRVALDDQDNLLRWQDSIIPNSTSGRFDYRFWHKDGSLRWIANRTSSWWDANANCWIVTAVETDITAQKLLELELTHSQGKIQHILDTVFAYLYGYHYYPNDTWAYDFMSSGCDKVFGFTVDQLKADSNLWLSRLAPGDRHTLRDIVNAIRKEQSITVEYRYHHPDGTLRWIASSHISQWDHDADAWRVTAIDFDITARKHLEQNLQQQTQRQQALSQVIQAIRNSLDLPTIFHTAAEQTRQFLNINSVRVVEYRPHHEEWWVQTESLRSPDIPSWLHRSIPANNNAISQQLLRGEVVQIHDQSALQDVLNQSIYTEATGQWLLVPIGVGGGTWGSLSCIAPQGRQPWQPQDVEMVGAIAEQLAIAIQQAQLYEQVRHLNTQLESTVDRRTAELLRSLNFEALLRRITDQVRISLDESQIMQTVVELLVNELNLDCCDSGIYDLENQLSTIAYEHTVTLPSANGTVIPMQDYKEIYQQVSSGSGTQFCWLDCSYTRPNKQHYALLVVPIIDDQGILGDLWLFRSKQCGFELTEVRLVEQVAIQCAIALRQSRLYQASLEQVEALEKLNLLKDDFLCTVSHELRSPMSNIKMASEMLEIILRQANALSSEDQRALQYFRILQDECDRETGLINDLLDLSRLEAEIEPLYLSTLPLKAWTLHVAEPFVEKTQQQQQQLRFQIPDDLPPLTTDFTYLEMVLTELFHNACKYTPPHEAIEVQILVGERSHVARWTRSSATEPESNPNDLLFQIAISNSGVEIPPEEHDRIFDKFYRIPNGDPWKHGGTGLGLALVKRRVERLSGCISVSSQRQCTTFTLTLPCLIPVEVPPAELSDLA